MTQLTKSKDCYQPFLYAISHPACVFNSEVLAKNDAWYHLSDDEQKSLIDLGLSIEVGEQRFLEGFIRVSKLPDENTFIQYVKDESEYLLYRHAIKAVTHESLVILNNLEIINCNIRFVQMLGFNNREEILHEDITRFIREIDIDRLRLNGMSSPTQRIEIRINDRNGKLMIIEVNASEASIQEQEVLVLAFHDISARKRAEQVMFQSKELYRSLIENSPNGVYIIIDQKIRYANASGVQLFGANSEDDLYNRQLTEFIESTDAEYVGKLLENARNGEEVDFEEIMVRGFSNQVLKAEFRASLTVYDGAPSVQVTLTNLSTREELLQEKVKAKLAEEINNVLKREIEEHKATQVRLRSARNYTRSIIDSSIDMIMASDMSGTITEFNLAARKQFGYTEKQVSKLKVAQLIAGHLDFNLVETKLKQNKTYVGELQAIDKDGREFTCFLSASLIKGVDGKMEGYMAVARDITLIKKAEERLRKSEERYRDIFENATDFIFSVSLEGELLYANDALTKALGYSQSGLKNISVGDFIEDYKGTKKDLLKRLAGEAIEVVLIDKNDNKIIAEGNSSVKYKKGEPFAVRAILRDVTDQRETQRYAMEQRAKLDSIFNSTENIMMCTLDKNSNFTSFNTNFADSLKNNFGVKVKTGANYLQLLETIINRDLYQRQLDGFKRAFTGKAQQFELPVIGKDGKNAWLLHFLNPVRIDSQKELEEISILAYDVTDRKEIDRKILDSLREKEVLLQEVHHRVKNNLQVISSILNLQSGYVKDEKTLEILEESQNRIKSMSFIHETLYQTNDFGSIEFGDYIETIARNLVHSYSYSQGEITLETEFDQVHLSLDQGIPCGLIINELVSNTLKYAFPDNRDGKINISIKEKKGKIMMSVKDNGIGLPKEFRYQDSDSLGVQLVYALGEQLDADIKVSSTKGTAFIFTFTKQ